MVLQRSGGEKFRNLTVYDGFTNPGEGEQGPT